MTEQLTDGKSNSIMAKATGALFNVILQYVMQCILHRLQYPPFIFLLTVISINLMVARSGFLCVTEIIRFL